MKKFIIYFFVKDKKNQKNQFHIEAKTQCEAIEKMVSKIPFDVSILGIGLFTWKDELFINEAIY